LKVHATVSALVFAGLEHGDLKHHGQIVCPPTVVPGTNSGPGFVLIDFGRAREHPPLKTPNVYNLCPGDFAEILRLLRGVRLGPWFSDPDFWCSVDENTFRLFRPF